MLQTDSATVSVGVAASEAKEVRRLFELFIEQVELLPTSDGVALTHQLYRQLLNCSNEL